MYTPISDTWQYHFCREADRQWLEEAMDVGYFTPQQAIDFAQDTLVEAPEEPPYPSFHVSRIYSRIADAEPVCWLLNKVEANTSVVAGIATHPNFRGQGVTRELINHMMNSYRSGNFWEPKRLVWTFDATRFNSDPTRYSEPNARNITEQAGNGNIQVWDMIRDGEL